MKRKVIAAIALLVVIDNAQAGDPFMDQLTQRVLTGPAAALVGLLDDEPFCTIASRHNDSSGGLAWADYRCVESVQVNRRDARTGLADRVTIKLGGRISVHPKGIAAFDTVAAIDEQLAASVQRIRGTAPVTWEQRSDFYLRNPKFARLVNKRRSLVNNALIDARNQAIHHERAVKGPAWKPDEEESGGKGCKSGGLSDEVCDNIRDWQEWKRGR